MQAALASQGIVLASSVLVADLLDRGWLEQHEPDVNLTGRRYTALCLKRNTSLRKVRDFLTRLQADMACHVHQIWGNKTMLPEWTNSCARTEHVARPVRHGVVVALTRLCTRRPVF